MYGYFKNVDAVAFDQLPENGKRAFFVAIGPGPVDDKLGQFFFFALFVRRCVAAFRVYIALCGAV